MMGYEPSSTAKRQLPKAGASFARVYCMNAVVGAWLTFLKRKHGLSAAEVKTTDANVASYHHLTSKERPLKTRRRLAKNAVALTQVVLHDTGVIVSIILTLQQETRPGLANHPALKGRKAFAQAGDAEAGHKSGQCKPIESSNVKGNQNATRNAHRNIEASALYIIKPSPGKGLGMFAATAIRKGTRILAEKPFLTFATRPKISLTDPKAADDITEAFDRLSTGEERKYTSLHCPQSNDCSVIVSIYEANNFEMGTGTGMCLDASRINHSCIPNAHFSWNANIERETVHAVKDIRRGEEISISYLPAICTLKERQRQLEPYVFACDCPACHFSTEFGTSSLIRRRKMLDLDHEIADYQNDLSAARVDHVQCDELSAILRLVRLMDEEGLVYEKALAYHDAALCALKRGLAKEALVYASIELGVDMYCVGWDSPSSDETIDFFRRICLGAEEGLK